MHGVSGYAHALVCPCSPGRHWLHQRHVVPCGCYLTARCVWAVCVLKGLHHSHCILTRLKISCNSSEFALLTYALLTPAGCHMRQGCTLTPYCPGPGLLRDCVRPASEGRRRRNMELLGETKTPLQANNWWVRLYGVLFRKWLSVFPWCSGYHVSLTHSRSPVRSRAETLFALFFCWVVTSFIWWPL